MTRENPAHAQSYIQKFRDLSAQGADIFGEARTIDAMATRGSAILDAGCGPGRISGYLHQQGHRVTGVDIDPELITAARQDYPGPRYLVGDLADLGSTDLDRNQGFDLIVCSGNVVTFLHPDTRIPVLAGFAKHLANDGRVVVGFGAERGYSVSDFDADVRQAGLTESLRFSTWELRPWANQSDFLVAVLTRRAA